MDDKLPVIYLTIDENDEAGVDAIALVDNPAIERQWMAFNKSKAHSFAITSEEKRVISGPLMISDFPIYRKDDDGREYYVIFNADTIRKIVYKYMKEGGLTQSTRCMRLLLMGCLCSSPLLLTIARKLQEDTMSFQKVLGSARLGWRVTMCGMKSRLAIGKASQLRDSSPRIRRSTLRETSSRRL
jgi:hypothetical protein